MAEESSLQPFPARAQISLVNSEARDKLIARGRESAADLLMMNTLYLDCGLIQIAAPVLRGLLDRVRFCLPGWGSYSKKHLLDRVLILITKISLVMITCDGHRLCRAERRLLQHEQPSEPRRIVIPFAVAERLHLELTQNEAGIVQISDRDDHPFLTVNGHTIPFERLNEYADYEPAIQLGSSRQVSLPAVSLTAAIRRAWKLADALWEGAIIRLESDLISISSSLSKGHASESLFHAPYAQEPLTVAFRTKYLLDFLDVLDDGQVVLEFAETTSAIQMTQECLIQGVKHSYFLMPMKLPVEVADS